MRAQAERFGMVEGSEWYPALLVAGASAAFLLLSQVINPVFLTAVLLAAPCVALAYFRPLPGFLCYLVAIQIFALGDTDDNMRMMQVRGLLHGQGWFDLQQHRLAGSNIHWSRLVDLPIAGLILLLRPLVGGAAAERWAVGIAPADTNGLSGTHGTGASGTSGQGGGRRARS